jgi:type IV secretory pathway VirB2 component (pilin)
MFKFDVFYKKLMGLEALILITPTAAFADDSGDKVTSALQNLLTFVSSTWGTLICSLAIVGVGFACFVMGVIPVSRAIAVAIGAACVMGAPRLLALITGSS